MSYKQWYQMTVAEVLQQQLVQVDQGLVSDEVKKRQEDGVNELSEGQRVSGLAIFLHQFQDFMVLVLLGATLISGLLGEYLDAITIIAIIIMNSILGFIQEFKAERSLSKLKQLSAPTAKVTRDHIMQHIPAKDLVQGDIVSMESGDRVPADVRWIEVHGLFIEESTLTGESVPVCKSIDAITEDESSIADQLNMGFLGTMVVRGTAKAVVVRTGMQTEMGKIAHLIQSTQTLATPLQRRLEQLGKLLIGVAIGLTVVVVVAGIVHGQPPYEMFLAGVSLAVAAIPEGLPAIVTIALALGVQRLIKREAIVRKLPSVETLGCASAICSDKTGTLTQNKMTVTHLWVNGLDYEVTGDGYAPHGEIQRNHKSILLSEDSSLRKLIEISAFCNNAQLIEHTNPPSPRKPKSMPSSQWVIQGDPTEGALVVLAAKAGFQINRRESAHLREKEFPFDAQRKRMSVLVAHQSNRWVCTKGAPDLLMEVCSYILWGDKVIPFTATLKQKVLAANEHMAKAARRVLALSYRELHHTESCSSMEEAEQKLIFVGLVGMFDPPRKEAREAIRICHKAGIKTVMITGDHQTTAEAVAVQIGMLSSPGSTLSGRELQAMDDEELDRRIDDTQVFARVTPEHKLRIVQSFQRQGHVVAMTGDGVNDAPAIKAADIGIAMGITGTDVTKEAADLVLRDDNFATIVASIEEGRNIYENIRKFIRYLLASNVGEIMTMFLAMMMGMPLPLIPIQILWVNLVTDGLPAMALGVDPAEKDVMTQQPRQAKESIFARRLGWKIISRGMLIGICTLIAFWLILRLDPTNPEHLIKAQTVAFATLVMAQLIHVFDCRSSRSIFHRNPFQNKYLVLAVISSLILLLFVMYMESLQPIFKTVPLGLAEWVLVLVFASIPSVLMGVGSVLQPSPPRHSNNKRLKAQVKFK